MADTIDESNKDNSREPDANATSSSQKTEDNVVTPENTDATLNEDSDAIVVDSKGAEAGKPKEIPTADDPESEKAAPFNGKDKENVQEDEQVETNPPLSSQDAAEHVPPPTEAAETDDNPEPSEEQPATADELPSPKDESQRSKPAPTSEESTEDPQPHPETESHENAEAKLVDDEALKKVSQSSIRETGAEHAETPADAEEESTPKAASEPADDFLHNITDVLGPTDKKPTKASLEELVRKASESSSRKKSKQGNTSLTARLYEEQIRTGKLNRLTSVVKNEDGTKRPVNPGSVPRWNTVDISLTGKRPMPSEKCRKGEHNCFDSAAARRDRALSASLAQGLYPDFMKLNPKLNEFVAASILEKLRLKGMAAPLHLYKGQYLPSDVLAEMVLKPKTKKVTDRYYFGYNPPPNRPRVSTEFRRYLQQFAQRHKAEESDLCFSYALRKVRHLAGQSSGHMSLPQTLAEVVRAQEEPGFGVKRLRRPHTAVI